MCRKPSLENKRNFMIVHSDESHTSVTGMREIAASKSVTIKAFGRNDDGSPDLSPPSGLGSSLNLVAFPAMSNFCGYRFPLEWIDIFKAEYSGNLVLLDAASHMSSATLDLSAHKPDFVCVSFYKMFGYPTGVGALIVRQSALSALGGKRYFGGGAVEMNLVRERAFEFRKREEDWLEDGTLPFLEIVALVHGFNAIRRLPQGIEGVSRHTHALSRHFYERLKAIKHKSGRQVARVYSTTDYSDREMQGPVVNFNLLKEDGSFYGFAAFRRLAMTRRIALRTGCFCNIGACQKYLGISDGDVLRNYRVLLRHDTRNVRLVKCSDRLVMLFSKPLKAQSQNAEPCRFPLLEGPCLRRRRRPH